MADPLARHAWNAGTVLATAAIRNSACTVCTTTPCWCAHAQPTVAKDTTWSISARMGAATRAIQIFNRFLEPWRPVDHRVDRHPRQHDEIPVSGVLRDVDEALAFHRLLEHDGCQHQRVDHVGDQVERMKSEKHPYAGPIRAVVPADVQCREF